MCLTNSSPTLRFQVANIPLQEGLDPAKQDAPTMGPVVGVVDASPPWATASQLLQLAQISRAELNPQAQAAIWIAHLEGHMKINVDAAASKHGNRGVVAAICREMRLVSYVTPSVLAVPGISDLATLEVFGLPGGSASCC
jgi:hypothetical protein